MKNVTLGKTGISVAQNQFGALPIQRIPEADAVALVRRAYEGGMRFFDTARVYSNSEERLGIAFAGMRDKVYIASKTMAKTPDEFWDQLDTTLANLRTDYLDLYQFHCVDQVWRPGDGTGMYECMQEAKAQGKIRHIGVTAHKLEVAFDLVNSGLYETLQYPFSYLASDREHELVSLCKEKDVGFIAMKGMAGGLITRSDVAMAYLSQFDNVLPIWGIQRESELDEWLSYFENTPEFTPDMQAFVAKERAELAGNFCRGCGYCLPCTVDIMINQCARMSLLLRRAPSENFLRPKMQAEMEKINDCTECGLCMTRCPYGLNIPELLKENYADYQRVLKGEVLV
ncbi:MAG: aldo/keto reductase [Eggerthellaceae bacterium]|jgi:predicted aldo/keto reductase-like oxidoreductase